MKASTVAPLHLPKISGQLLHNGSPVAGMSELSQRGERRPVCWQ